MKIRGKEKAGSNTAIVTFARTGGNIEVVVSPVRLGWYSKVHSEKRLTIPEPPVKPKRDDMGLPIIRDGVTVTEEDRRNPEYRATLQNQNKRMTALNFVEVVRNDNDIEFEASLPDSPETSDWEAYADAIWSELNDFGLTDEEVDRVIEVASDLSGANSLEDAANHFFSRLSGQLTQPQASSLMERTIGLKDGQKITLCIVPVKDGA